MIWRPFLKTIQLNKTHKGTFIDIADIDAKHLPVLHSSIDRGRTHSFASIESGTSTMASSDVKDELSRRFRQEASLTYQTNINISNANFNAIFDSNPAADAKKKYKKAAKRNRIAKAYLRHQAAAKANYDRKHSNLVVSMPAKEVKELQSPAAQETPKANSGNQVTAVKTNLELKHSSLVVPTPVVLHTAKELPQKIAQDTNTSIKDFKSKATSLNGLHYSTKHNKSLNTGDSLKRSEFEEIQQQKTMLYKDAVSRMHARKLPTVEVHRLPKIYLSEKSTSREVRDFLISKSFSDK